MEGLDTPARTAIAAEYGPVKRMLDKVCLRPVLLQQACWSLVLAANVTNGSLRRLLSCAVSYRRCSWSLQPP